MGFPPPPDAPSVSDQALVSAEAGFDDGLPAAQLCGLQIPYLFFGLGFNLPAIEFPPGIPQFGLSLGLNCDLDNPINVSAKFSYGGGRVSTSDPDPDLAFDQAA